MIISHKHRFVFLHNPKCGGTSVRDALAQYADVDSFRFCGYADSAVQDLSHLRVDQWTREVWDAYREGYFFFGLVRDPIDRFMSAMSEFRHQHLEHDRFDLETLLPQLLTTNSILYDWRFIHFSPQWSYFALHRGFIHVPMVHLFDIRNLEQTLGSEEFAKQLGLPETLKVGNGRPSYFRPKEISDNLRSFAASLYQDDYAWLSGQGFDYISPPSKIGPSHGHRLDAIHAGTLNMDNYPPCDGITERMQRWEIAAIERRPQGITSQTERLLVQYLHKSVQERQKKSL